MSVYWKLNVCVGKHASAINSSAWITFLFYTLLCADFEISFWLNKDIAASTKSWFSNLGALQIQGGGHQRF